MEKDELKRITPDTKFKVNENYPWYIFSKDKIGKLKFFDITPWDTTLPIVFQDTKFGCYYSIRIEYLEIV